MRVKDVEIKLGDDWVRQATRCVGCTRQAVYQWKRKNLVPIDAAIRLSSCFPSLTIAVSLYRRPRPNKGGSL